MNRDLNSTVQIIASQSQPAFSQMVAGTGWFPDADVPEGTIVTNAHVVNGAVRGSYQKFRRMKNTIWIISPRISIT